ncbi:MAG TPA: response regulator [Verrucomicrobiae bacterium]|nr:response regulator [Verrucomicrobiae bacterium]
MQTFTLSMPDGDNLLSPYEDPNCSGQRGFSPASEAVSARSATPEAVPPLTEPMPSRETGHEAATEHVSRLRARLHTFLKADDAARTSHIHPLQQAVQEFARRAEIGGRSPLGRVVTQIESFIQQIGKAPGKIGDPTARTLAHSFDFLASLVTHARTRDPNLAEHINVLAVDDEAIPRQAIFNALTGAGVGCVTVGGPAQALSMLAETQFDLVIFDIDMPGINGHELCRRMRAMPGYAKVPVFFVTGLTDFQTRVQSLRSGGDDFICKPFLSHELVVKAMVTIFEQHLGLSSKSPSQPPETAGCVLPVHTRA